MDIIAKDRMKTTSQISYCLVTSVDGKKCTILFNNESYVVPYYGGVPEVNKTYPINIPQNNMNKAYIIGEGEKNESGLGYCKMPDGTLIQWGTDTLNVVNALSQIGTSGIYATLASFRFPISFVDTNYSFNGQVKYSTGYEVPCGFIAASGASCSVRIYDFYARPASSTLYVLDWMAIGRWK